MTKPTEPDHGSMLGPLEAAEEDFKVFRIIENTLIGALIFMGSYLRT